jgi:hypothetical protein
MGSNSWTVRNQSELTSAHRRTGPHNWYHVKGFRFPWPICSKCGLIWLKNAASAMAAKKPCKWEDDLC